MAEVRPEAKPERKAGGLRNVVAGESGISSIDGQRGVLAYRGIDIHALAERSSFEEVVYLLHHGVLPTRAQLEELRATLVRERPIPAGVMDLLRALPAGTHPMTALRTAVSALGAFDPDANDDGEAARKRKAVRLIAQMATLVAAVDRLRHGAAPVPPDPGLGHAANFLFMLTGSPPSAVAARAMDVALVLHADHEFNASTFAARVVASTGADCGAALSAAVGALSGPLHGGAPAYVKPMLEEVAASGDAEGWVRERLATGQRIMGFGHRVYRAEDPRSRILKRVARELEAPQIDVAEELEQVALAALREKSPDRPLETNVEYYSAVVLDVAEIPPPLAPAMFACSRVAGWSAHILEQKRTGRLFRPSARYLGPAARSLEPVS